MSVQICSLDHMYIYLFEARQYICEDIMHANDENTSDESRSALRIKKQVLETFVIHASHLVQKMLVVADTQENLVARELCAYVVL